MSASHKYGPNLQVIGVTGGVGSGKSTVLELLARRGLTVIKADDIAHKVILPGTPAHRRIVNHFGNDILSSDGTIDRGRLGETVFSNKEDLAFLNSIVHPPVIEQLRRCFEEIAASGDHVTLAVEIPLLVEAGMVDTVDHIVLVTAPRDVRMRRMTAQGWTARRARAVMEAQAADAERAKIAGTIIDNSGDLDELPDKVDEALVQIANGALR